MPPRRIPPMMGRNYGMNHQHPFMMGRPQRGPNFFAGNRTPSRQSPFGGFGMNQGRPRGRSGGLLSKITGGSNGNSGGGGLLSKLLGGGQKAANGVTGFEGIARGGGASLSSLGQSGGLMNILNQTQSMLKTVSQIQPMIQQYGPLVRNIPAMWKLYRELKSSDSGEEENQKTEKSLESTDTEQPAQKPKLKGTKKKGSRKVKKSSAKSNAKGTSSPKLYV